MKTAHTATPWRLSTTGKLVVADIECPHADGSATKSERIISATYSYDGRDADAEFIVTACNAHDDLVAALKDAMRLLKIAGYNLEGTATGRMKDALIKAGAA